MSCACDYDGSGFSSDRSRIAAKLHKCKECRQAIAKGERYVYVSGQWEGLMFSYRVCLTCDAWGEALEKAARNTPGACDCWSLGSLWEAIAEFGREYPKETKPPGTAVEGTS